MSFFGRKKKDKFSDENNTSFTADPDYLDKAYGSMGDGVLDEDENSDNFADEYAFSNSRDYEPGEGYEPNEGREPGESDERLNSDNDPMSGETDGSFDPLEETEPFSAGGAYEHEDSSAYDGYSNAGSAADMEYEVDSDAYGRGYEIDAADKFGDIEPGADETGYFGDFEYAANDNAHYNAKTSSQDSDEYAEYASANNADGGETGGVYDSGDTEDMDSENINRRLERIRESEADSLLDGYQTEFNESDGAEDDRPDGGLSEDVWSDGSGGVYDEYDTDGAEAEDDTNDDIYAAYAPKSVKVDRVETSYYDLDSFGKEEKPPKKSRFKNFFKKYKKWMIGAGAAVLVVAIVVCSVSYISYRADPLRGYTQITVTNGNVIKTMSCTGSVEPFARYEIKSTVSGSITESPLNAGDTVRAGELVYKVDDTNAQLAVQQAENAVERAQAATQSASSSSSDSVRIYANATGTISNLNIQSGSRLSGGQIATITQADGNEVALTPNITGTVSSVSVREGSRVTSGQLIATVTTDSTGPSREELELDEQGAQIALEAAQQELAKYRIASPVDGTILVKNAKVGDVASADSGEPMMVIADMSRMKFSVEIDEMDIWEIEQGQLVVITAAALPGQTFMGEITNVGGEGNVKGNGITTYNVEITINDPGKLRSGMNIDARIVLDSASNALTLPDNALYEADGTNALVIARIAGGADEERVVDGSEYPGIFVPDGYQLVQIEYGVSDGVNVEIVSGLRAGDEVLYIKDENSPESASGGFNANSVSLPTPTAGSNSSSDDDRLSGADPDIIIRSDDESGSALDALPDTSGSGADGFGLHSTDRYATMEQ
ncbi:MAG TPA: efflux RND transporter periplasmic adaptor subunit [Firmicutes bacterium]|nr:efflux RND transporter periplasmic adaptor subunit [Bacillota bacterium]